MVKRTLVVLAILSLMLAPAGMSFGQSLLPSFGGWSAGWDAPTTDTMFVPVDCPPCPDWVPVVKEWKKTFSSAAPCGAVYGPGVGSSSRDPWLRGAGIASLMTPFDALFGGMDAVYGCGIVSMGPASCGPCFGPLPYVLSGPVRMMAAPTLIFGTLW
jgi:hypothetical protein